MCATVSLCVQTELKMSAMIRILVTLLVVCSAVSVQSDVETQAAEFLERFDKEATERIYNYSLASWAYNTNITKENSQNLVSLPSNVTPGSNRVLNISHDIVVGSHCDQADEGQIWSNFYTKMSEESQKFDLGQIKNREIKLQLISLQDKGSGALSAEKAQHVRLFVLLSLTTEMSCSSSFSFILIMYLCCIFCVVAEQGHE